jgi:hypothetical protein
MSTQLDVIRALNTAKDINDLINLIKPYDILSELPLREYTGEHLYCRQADYPKGTLIVGKVHKIDHVFILLKGELTIWDYTGKKRIKAPAVFESKAGVQRVGFMHSDVSCITVHGTSFKTVDLNTVTDYIATDTVQEYLEQKGEIEADFEKIIDESAPKLPRLLQSGSL